MNPKVRLQKLVIEDVKEESKLKNENTKMNLMPV
jgi:hypothetical protein